jgi:ribosome-binding ATPase YchF (GTP1/OBG family)
VKGDKNLRPVLELTINLREHLAQGLSAASFAGVDDPLFQELNHELRFLTAKPMIYVANVDETGLEQGNAYVDAVQEIAAEEGVRVIVLCAQLEQEMLGMTEEERREFLELAGAEASGLELVVRASFEMLDLISFFTFNEREARAWNVPRGATAPQAAGAIHTDFERGFIRAEVIPFETFTKYGSSTAVKAAGLMRLEGKDYLVQDGDVIYFRFNV